MKAPGWKLAALAGLVVLSACGGGGDNAGVCSGSEEVCGRPPGATTAGTTGITASTPDTTLTTSATPTTSGPPTTTTATTLGSQ